MQVAAETYKVFAALEIRFPASKTLVVTKVKVLRKLICEIFVTTVVRVHVRYNWPGGLDCRW